ncbi:MAG: RecQ family ATP-dependent DNA helicase [Terriglobales bacterium]
MIAADEIMAALRRHWGFDSFRPLQERIVASLLAGRDTCVVMPTGGGKSLCYQLPAALWRERTVIVVSPLIALMQDQVHHLEAMGIAAAQLNSSMPASQQSQIQARALQGRYRLIYLSPERLARADTLAWMRRLPLALVAIDEAHCISEWGHEFRPDYRQLSALRREFPDLPLSAFTASATRRVRHDILEQLQLRAPDRYIASFHRANLRYLVRPTTAREQPALLLRALRHHEGARVIVYAPTIVRVEETAAMLEREGIPAIAYHGKMEADARRQRQERWMAGEKRVLVGTLAFGLGIDQAEVRAVIHLALPKSIEQYYQEAGRAGRDGQPADCLLLWQKRDAGLLAHFIEQIEDGAERERGWQRYHAIRGFAESKRCRHRQICLHFGERPGWEQCGACDVCGAAAEYLAGPRPGAKRERARPAARLEPGRAAAAALPPAAAGLREHLRAWRLEAARQRGVPAFVLFSNRSLDELCQHVPATLAELETIYGFGPGRAAQFGAALLQAIKDGNRP